MAAGQKAQAVGAMFEGGLNIYHDQLFAQGLALIAHTGPPVIWTAPDEVKVVGDAPPDYMGALSEGIPVLFDAKTTANKDKITLSDKDAGHQLAWMKNIHRTTGGRVVVGFFFWWREQNEYVFYPVDSTSDLVFLRSLGISCGDNIQWHDPVLSFYKSLWNE